MSTKSNNVQEAPGAKPVVNYDTMKMWYLNDLLMAHATLQRMDFTLELEDFNGILKQDSGLTSADLKARFEGAKRVVNMILTVPGLTDVVCHHIHNYYLTQEDNKHDKS